MSDKTPIKAYFAGTDAVALGEFESGDTVPVSAGGTGATSASAARTNLGLGNVDNTSDANKPVSTAQQTALNLKANLASPALTGTPTAPTASVGTNTTQVATTALVKATADLQVPKAGGTMTGSLTAPSFTSSGSTGLRFTTWATAGTSQFNILAEANTGYPTALYAIHNPGSNAFLSMRFNSVDTFIYYNSGTASKVGGGSWTDISDQRTKDDIEDWDFDLDDVMSLRVRQWRYKPETGRDTSRVFRGLVAQEAEQHAPTLVSSQKGAIGDLKFDDLRTVDPSDLPYILLIAIQKMQRQIEALQAGTPAE